MEQSLKVSTINASPKFQKQLSSLQMDSTVLSRIAMKLAMHPTKALYVTDLQDTSIILPESNNKLKRWKRGALIALITKENYQRNIKNHNI